MTKCALKRENGVWCGAEHKIKNAKSTARNTSFFAIIKLLPKFGSFIARKVKMCYNSHVYILLWEFVQTDFYGKMLIL